MPHETVSDWIDGLKAGDSDAARRLWDRYFQDLVALARRKLGSAPRRVADEEDVALSVFHSLCAGAARGQFPDLADRDDLWWLLLVITRRKAVHHVRHQTALKRGGGLEVGESAIFKAAGDGASRPSGLEQIADERPTAEFLLLLSEEHQRLMGALRDDVLRRIAFWKMQGDDNPAIAERLQISLRAVQRKLNLIRRKWLLELRR